MLGGPQLIPDTGGDDWTAEGGCCPLRGQVCQAAAAPHSLALAGSAHLIGGGRAGRWTAQAWCPSGTCASSRVAFSKECSPLSWACSVSFRSRHTSEWCRLHSR